MIQTEIRKDYRNHMLQQNFIFEKHLLPFPNLADPFTFASFIEDYIGHFEELTRNSIKETLEKADEEFKNSKDRKRRYYIKYKRPRTFTCMAGTITYNRTIYIDRSTNKTYCYVDEKFGIRKRIKYTDDVGAKAYEMTSNNNSMIKVGEELGKMIHTKFTIKKDSIFAIPRQSIYNLLKRVKEINIVPKANKKIVDNLYILMDEKYIGNQEKDSSNIMVKSALINEGLIITNKRHKYLNPKYFSKVTNNFGEELVDFLDKYYDLEKVNKIHVLADGGTWIKEVFNSSIKPINNNSAFYLDKFHFTNTLWSIVSNKRIYYKIISYYKHSSYDDIRKALSVYRNEKTETRIKYLLNNKFSITNILNLKKMNCAAEQVISHHIASIFSSVPKAYKTNNINRYLSTRDNLKNGENLKEIYLLALHSKDPSPITTIDKNPVDYYKEPKDSEQYKQGSEYRYVHYSLSYNNLFQ